VKYIHESTKKYLATVFNVHEEDMTEEPKSSDCCQISRYLPLQ